MAASTIWAEASDDNQASILVQLLRWIGLAVLIPCYVLSKFFLLGLTTNQWGAQLLLKLLNVHCAQHCKVLQAPALLVSNHVSWLDPMVTAATGKVAFITSHDTRKHAFLGTIAKLGGCLFVSRKPWSLRNEIAEIAEQISTDTYIAFYPEATSSDGSQVRPFHASFFEVAVAKQIPVQPVAFRWLTREVAYYGEMTFGAHLLQTMGLKSIELELLHLPPLYPAQFKDRKALCAAAEQSIRAALRES